MTQVSARMAPAPAGRRTFAVGKLSWRRSEIRLVEPRRLEVKAGARWSPAAIETVH